MMNPMPPPQRPRPAGASPASPIDPSPIDTPPLPLVRPLASPLALPLARSLDRPRAGAPARARLFPLALLIAGVTLPAAASAAVTGREGVEIEGPRDRRGFYIGPGLNMGAQVFTNTIVPAPRLDLAFGGGVTKNFTLGLVLNLGVYVSSSQARKAFFGGDVEATGFLIKGFFIRGAVGGAGVPRGDGTTELAFGLGGAGGLGYEFWLNQTAALALSLSYDARYVAGMGMRQAGYLGLRFTWY
jgi:hypothetical protein